MRYIRYAFLAVIAICLVVLSLANLETVTLNTLPDGMASIPGMGPFAMSFQLPLFVVILGGIVLGLLLGFVWEWIREHKHRAEAAKKQAEVKQLERQLKKTKAERDEGKDEVLALLDEAG